MKARYGAAILGAAVLTATGFTAAANAAPPPSAACSGGELASGTYSNVRITGNCMVPDGAAVIVRGNLTVTRGAVFDASTHSTLTVRGNVTAKPGSMLALGCTQAHPCSTDGTPGEVGADVVKGNVTLDHVYNAAFNGITIHGNLTSHGGGAGPATDPFIPFSIKDDTIHGNVVVQGLNTTWFGVIRSTIGGNVVLKNIQNADPDGNEVVANTIGKNLVCHGNSPKPQLGDAVDGAPPGYGPNSVGGKAVGQCAALPES